jgi:ribosomal protein L29
MKKVTQKDIATMKDDALTKILKEYREALKNIGFGFSGKENEANAPRKVIRRTIARLLTEVQSRALSTSTK